MRNGSFDLKIQNLDNISQVFSPWWKFLLNRSILSLYFMPLTLKTPKSLVIRHVILFLYNSLSNIDNLVYTEKYQKAKRFQILKLKIATIIFIVFWDSLIFWQIFLSPQGKRCAIITYKHGTYELPNELRLRILENCKILETCPNFIKW